MKRATRTIIVICVASFLMIRCDKDSIPKPEVPVTECLLTEEVYNSGALKTRYEYNEQNNVRFIRKLNSFDQETVVIKVQGNEVRFDYEDATGDPAYHLYSYWNSNIYKFPPASAYTEIMFDGITYVYDQTFLFSYDEKGRLKKISQTSDHKQNDFEYDLSITYNDEDNVIGLWYEVTTGPVGATAITVKEYDDKPTPYTGVKGFPFMMAHHTWNSADPGQIIAALSKNNPLDYTIGASPGKPSEFKRKMEYTYDENGYPVQRKNTNISEGKEYTSIDTFSYNCN